jgi:predicted nucleic acid-binding protein
VEITRRWWDNQRLNYYLVTSEYTLIELNRGSYPNKGGILDLIQGIETFSIGDDIDNIAEVYMREYVMPKGAAGDAFHLACASYHKIDYLLTWNCLHLANANKAQHIHITNGKLGLFTPSIVTPLQLFQEEEM